MPSMSVNTNILLRQLMVKYGQQKVIEEALKCGLTVGKVTIIGDRAQYDKLEEKLSCDKG